MRRSKYSNRTSGILTISDFIHLFGTLIRQNLLVFHRENPSLYDISLDPGHNITANSHPLAPSTLHITR